MDHVLRIYALFMLLGLGTTAMIKETKRKTLEELSGDNEDLVAPVGSLTSKRTKSPPPLASGGNGSGSESEIVQDVGGGK